MTAQISQVITVTKQLYCFKEYIKRLKKVVGIKVEGALMSISVGTNDFMISYYDLPSRRDDFSMDDYQDYILKKLQNFVNELYKHGCQTMVVSGLPLMESRLDLGNYECFLDVRLTRDNNITTGKIYQ
ncbi:hypothetical protein Lser_V15G24435 [Lactuca serriola]